MALITPILPTMASHYWKHAICWPADGLPACVKQSPSLVTLPARQSVSVTASNIWNIFAIRGLSLDIPRDSKVEVELKNGREIIVVEMEASAEGDEWMFVPKTQHPMTDATVVSKAIRTCWGVEEGFNLIHPEMFDRARIKIGGEYAARETPVRAHILNCLKAGRGDACFQFSAL